MLFRRRSVHCGVWGIGVCSTIFACGGRTDTGGVTSNLGRETPAAPASDGVNDNIDDDVSGSEDTEPAVVDGTTPSTSGVPDGSKCRHGWLGRSYFGRRYAGRFAHPTCDPTKPER